PNAPASPARRKLLLGAGAGAIAVAGGMATQGAVAMSNDSVTNAPESDRTQERQPFYGLHQPGIVTPRPAAGMVAAFDVLARDRTQLEQLLRTLTERAAFLMQGGRVPELDPKFP